MDQHVEKEADPGWTPKKIGGILVDRAEVERAKMCKLHIAPSLEVIVKPNLTSTQLFLY